MSEKEYQLSDDQYTLLTDGKPVKLTVDVGKGTVVSLFPPCSVRGHSWDNESGRVRNGAFVRDCERCDSKARIDLESGPTLDYVIEVVE